MAWFTSYSRRSRGFRFDNVFKTFALGGTTVADASSTTHFDGVDNQDLGLITDRSTSEEDLGLVTDTPATATYNLGVFATAITASQLSIPAYTVITVPTATSAVAQIIYVSDETNGATLAFSDGTNWRRVQDLAIIS